MADKVEKVFHCEVREVDGDGNPIGPVLWQWNYRGTPHKEGATVDYQGRKLPIQVRAATDEESKGL
jgi:hypothetical protein